jgi:hypothetical protein
MKENDHLIAALAIFLMMACPDIDAQIKSGYMIGFNISNTILETSGTSSEAETMTGIQIGIITEITLKGNLTLQSGLMFSAKGSIYKIDTSEVTISPIYIQIPVNAKYSIGSEIVKISLFAGPYFACGVGGNKDTGGELQKINFGSGENDDLQLFDIGFNFGAGINIKGFLISAQYELGLANLLPVITGDPEMKNRLIGISITTLFEGK